MKTSKKHLSGGNDRARTAGPRDKQLQTVNLGVVMEKCRLDQALNIKEFAVRAGISYSAARIWFSQPGFPAFRGVVFYDAFIAWRNSITATAGRSSDSLQHKTSVDPMPGFQVSMPFASERARQLLDESDHGAAPMQSKMRRSNTAPGGKNDQSGQQSALPTT